MALATVSRKKYYKDILRLAGPVILTQAGQILVQLVDNAMVGHLGTLPLASVSFANTVFNMLFMLAMGMTFGLTPLVGEMYSVGNFRKSAQYLQNSILLYGGMGLVIFGVMMAMIPLMGHMGQPAEVAAMAVPYYRYVVCSVIPFTIFAAFKQFLEGIGNTKVAMAIVITSNVVNIIFNWLLIYGNWGFPEMGASGAGLATLISRIITPILIITYFWKRDSFNRYFKLFSWKNFSWKRIKSLLRVGSPISLQMFMEVSAFALVGIMMGWIGTTELAANQIASIISNLAFLILISISSSVTICVSHAYGRRNFHEIRRYAGAGYRLGLMWNGIIMVIFLLLRNYIPMIFNTDPEVVRLAGILLIFVALFQIPDGLQSVSIGILRGIQDVKIIMLIAFVSYILISLPIGYVCAFTLELGAVGLWLGLIAGLTVAAVMGILRYRSQMRKNAGVKTSRA